ncbi:MAG: hypothetical protein JWO67_5163 [Streptosporangiaceae bacterium]|nr:hypothetical protein [Streptosporangiaceae bacterium]
MAVSSFPSDRVKPVLTPAGAAVRTSVRDYRGALLLNRSR